MSAELINIIDCAVRLKARNIHFKLTEVGDIRILLHEGQVMVAILNLDFKAYKKILTYIELHTTFDISNQKIREGKLILNNYPDTLECYVSILMTPKFKSLILHIKKPLINYKSSQRILERLCSRLIADP